MRHGIRTSIIEIDPAVYEAARTYFGLPDPARLGGEVHLEDARGWVHKAADNIRVGEAKQELYDIVIHDCFSGGGVPEHLYTVQFWDDLKTVMHPDGVLVVVSCSTLIVVSVLNEIGLRTSLGKSNLALRI